MVSFFALIDTVLSIYAWVIIIAAIMTWLVAFGVVNPRNQVVYTIGRALYQLTEPAIAPVRRLMPNLGGIDISPVIVLLIIFFLRMLLREYGPI